MKLSTTKVVSALFVLLISLFAITLIYFQILPFAQKNIQSALEQQLGAIAKISIPEIKQALTLKDDISLLLNIEKLSKQNNIESAYILDKEAVVIAHTSTQEWGKKYTAVTANIIFEKLKSKPFVKTTINNNTYYIFLLSSEHLLFLQSSIKDELVALATFKRNSLLLSAVMLIILSLVFYFIYKVSITDARSKLLKALNDTNVKLPKDLLRIRDEIKLRLTHNATKDKNNLDQNKLIFNYLENICSSENGVIIFDANNTLTFANKKAKNIFTIKEDQQTHLLDVIKNPQTLLAIESTIKTKTPKLFFDTKSNINIKITAFYNTCSFVGLSLEVYETQK